MTNRTLTLALLSVFALSICLLSSVSIDVSNAATSWQVAFKQFCKRVPAECAPYESQAEVTPLSLEQFAELRRVNVRVNRAVKYQDDQKHYNDPDYWAYPTDGKGDCEDYALEKRRRLVKLGWPRHRLLIGIVEVRHKQKDDDLHAILLVKTPGDYLILDSIIDSKTNRQIDEITPLKQEKAYRLLAIQSNSDPREFIYPVSQ